ncbi:putative 2OG-Fe(II) oxygenase [Biformimicrobium ophioploci]|nr:tetratricopeptide repeat protein [Microbulbifer sp. NKW57]
MNNLDQAIRKIQSGDIASAQQLLEVHLKSSPSDFNALQLLGLVKVRQGELQAAQALMQKSLAIHGKQPHVMNNLASCERQLGNSPSALSLFRQAIALKPDYLDPYLGFINATMEADDLPAADAMLHQALQRWPSEARLLQYKARLAQEHEQYTDAIAIYRSLVLRNPSSASYRHNLAIALRLSGKSRDALAIYQQLMNEGTSSFQLFHNAANAHADCAENGEAIELYQAAIKLNPTYVPAHKNLNDLLWETGNREEFLASYRAAMQQHPSDTALHFSYVDALICVSLFDEALAHLNQLGRSHPHFNEEAEYLSLSGRALSGRGDLQGAADIQQPLARQQSATPQQLTAYARSLIEAERGAEAAEILEPLVSRYPDDQMALAYLGTCWRLNGNKKYDRLNNYGEMVREFMLEPPAGYASIEAFCSELESYLLTLHGGEHEPIDQTLVNGSQTRGNLFNDSNLLIRHVQGQANRSISQYVEETAPLLESAIGFRGAREWQFSGSWSVVLREQGYHASHIHPMGWVSAVLYVSLPDLDACGSQQGWLKLGQPNLSGPITERLPPRRHVKPQRGKLVIFPSYMWHGTEPFDAQARRITIAFDARRTR